MSGDDSIERVREVRERLVNAGTVIGPDGRSRELFPVAIGVEEGASLRGWVRKEGAQRTLEVGLGFAISTLFIVEGLLENGSASRSDHERGSAVSLIERRGWDGLARADGQHLHTLYSFHYCRTTQSAGGWAGRQDSRINRARMEGAL